jgi:hypothetical protein
MYTTIQYSLYGLNDQFTQLILFTSLQLQLQQSLFAYNYFLGVSSVIYSNKVSTISSYHIHNTVNLRYIIAVWPFVT